MNAVNKDSDNKIIQSNMKIDETRLNSRLKNLLKMEGMTFVKDLEKLSEMDFSAMPGLGRESKRQLEMLLEQAGFRVKKRKRNEPYKPDLISDLREKAELIDDETDNSEREAQAFVVSLIRAGQTRSKITTKQFVTLIKHCSNAYKEAANRKVFIDAKYLNQHVSTMLEHINTAKRRSSVADKEWLIFASKQLSKSRFTQHDIVTTKEKKIETTIGLWKELFKVAPLDEADLNNVYRKNLPSLIACAIKGLNFKFGNSILPNSKATDKGGRNSIEIESIRLKAKFETNSNRSMRCIVSTNDAKETKMIDIAYREIEELVKASQMMQFDDIDIQTAIKENSELIEAKKLEDPSHMKELLRVMSDFSEIIKANSSIGRTYKRLQYIEGRI